VLGSNPPAPPLNRERVAGLAEPARQAWTDYLAASARQRQADRAVLAAERLAGRAIPAPPVSGKSEASMPLDRPSAWYASAEALRVADNIVSFQTPAGGWGKNQPRDQAPRQPGQAFVASNASVFAQAGDFDAQHEREWSYVGTIDNDATLTEIRFLARVQAALPATASAVYRTAAIKGLQYLLSAQFPNGGWPQVWPLQGGYHDAITLNDDAMVGVASLLGDVAAALSPFDFVPPDLRSRAALAQQRASRLLVELQVRVDGRRLLWAQQHDALSLRPVSARNYEPPALSSSESASVLMYLMRLPHPDADTVAAVDAAVQTLRELEIFDQVWDRPAGAAVRSLHRHPGARHLWARYYDVRTLKPVFGDRDKSVRDDVAEISPERRNGYAWFVTSPRGALQAYESWAHRLPERPVSASRADAAKPSQ